MANFVGASESAQMFEKENLQNRDRDYKSDTCRTCDTYSLYNRSHYGPNRNVA